MGTLARAMLMTVTATAGLPGIWVVVAVVCVCGGGWGCWWAGDPKCDLLAMGDWGLGHTVPWVGGDRAGVATSQEGSSG